VSFYFLIIELYGIEIAGILEHVCVNFKINLDKIYKISIFLNFLVFIYLNLNLYFIFFLKISQILENDYFQI